jgi:hypothetical protein
MKIKFSHQGETHILPAKITFSQLDQHVRGMYGDLPRFVRYYYIDSDGDKITVSSDLDLENGLKDSPNLRLMAE